MACSSPTPGAPADAGVDVAAPDVMQGPPPLRDYMPDGCSHRVYVPSGAVESARGDGATFGTRPAPANVHVSWPADPATTIGFVWTTDRATRATVVQYGTAPATLDRSATGHVASGGLTGNTVTAHEVHVCGLRPDTTYYYRVGGEGHWSAVQSFKTAPAPGQADYDVNFAVTGDSRDHVDVWQMVQERIRSASAMRQPDFEVFSGDAVSLGIFQGEWDAWFTGGVSTFRAMPLIPAHGNHEGLAVNYLLQFALPQVGRVEQDELYFSFDYGPLHLVFINDTPYRGDYQGGFMGTQLRWLREDLMRARSRRAAVPWIVAVHHKGPYSASVHTDDDDTVIVRNVLPPVYDEFDVDLVLNGHDHHFEISHPLDGQGRPVTGRPGTVYVTAAASGAPLYRSDEAPWRRHGESVVNFMLVHATMRALEVTPYRGDGTVIEQGRVTFMPQRP